MSYKLKMPVKSHMISLIWGDIKLKAPNEQTRKTNKTSDTDNSMVGTRGKRGRGSEEVKGVRCMVTQEDLTLGGGYTMRYTEDVSQNCTLKTYTILLTNITPINLTVKCPLTVKGKSVALQQKQGEESTAHVLRLPTASSLAFSNLSGPAK